MSVKDLPSLPPRPQSMHKGHRGKLLIVGGSLRYPGAPALSALAALRSGCGVVTLLSLPKVCELCASRLPEVVHRPVDDVAEWPEAARSEWSSGTTATVIGPGIGRAEAVGATVARTWAECPTPLLVDADGLNALAVNPEGLRRRDDAVLTPHEGEAGRLLGVSAAEVRADREGAARRLAERWGCVVLKGHNTIVCDGERAEEIPYGGPELSVPGSGDVLSGCIGAFLAMRLPTFDAALLGASVHAMAGDSLAQTGLDGVLASEIANSLRFVLHNLRLQDA